MESFKTLYEICFEGPRIPCLPAKIRSRDLAVTENGEGHGTA
jgi:hypothetical protein